MLGKRMLLFHSGRIGVGSADMGYSLTADEVRYWQDQAALLDPDAYVLFQGNSESETVPTGARWYLVNGWYLDAGSEGTAWFHRPAHVDHAFLLSEGTTIATTTAPAGTSHMYICQPELVVDNVSDDRYDDYQNDPRGLWFERIMHLATLEQFQIGSTNTGSSTANETFPGDFEEGMGLHTSSHDVAWTILRFADDQGGLNTLNELSDSSNQIRFAEPSLFPFRRSEMPTIQIQGSGKAEGRATFTYAKLPAGW